MYRCPLCGKVFEGVGQLRAHFRRKLVRFVVCPVCSRRFLNLEIHLAKMAERDDLHAAYYFLCMNDKKRDNKLVRMHAYQVAMEVFKVEV